MKRISTLFLLLVCCSGLSYAQSIEVSATNMMYSQDFDSLAKNGSMNDELPNGWDYIEIGNTLYADGYYGTDLYNGVDPNIYSLGDDPLNAPPYVANPDASDRAFGLQKHTVFFPSPRIGAKITNKDATLAITGFDMTYTGETWNQYSLTQIDTLKFYYSTDADSLGDQAATWIGVSGLDYTLLAEYDTINAYFLNYAGNLPGNQKIISLNFLNGFNVAPDHDLYISWDPTCDVGTYTNIGGVDDLIMTFHFGPSDTTGVGVGHVASETFKAETYPNPASDVLNLRITNARSELSWQIANSAGTRMKSGVCRKGKSYTEQIDVSNLAAGIYIIHLMTADNRVNSVLHFMKQ
jgi:hypothetical protein